MKNFVRTGTIIQCWITLSLFLCGLWLSVRGNLAQAASVDPHIEWKVIETDHFNIIYDQKLHQTARLFAWQAERAHFLLQPIFKEYPSKTHVLITDTSDLANGFASFLPMPMITVFPVMPDDLESISHYDNWAAELMIHEYTHILSFEPSNGFYTPFRYLFGSLVHPTGLLPSWWLEGLAVEMETRMTRRGRLRSPQYGASLRNMVLHQTLDQETIDRINAGDIPTWPFGQRPYLFGSLLWNHIIEEAGVEIAPSLLQAYSRRVPFLLNGPLQDRTQKSYQESLQELYQEMKQRTDEQIQKISQAGTPQEVAFNHSGTGQHSPAISPDQKSLIYVAYVPKQSGQIRLVERSAHPEESFATRPYEVLLKSFGTSQVAWLPDSSGFIFDQIKTFRRYYRYRDLYQFDLTQRKIKRLTFGARASDPAVSPDGKMAVFIQNAAARSQISLVNLKDRKINLLYRPRQIQTQISRPQFINNQEIVFAVHSPKGNSGLMTLKVAKHSKPRMILKDFIPARQPHMTEKGLLFISDRSGVSNLYLAHQGLSGAQALTNSPTEIINGEWDPTTHQLIYSQLDTEGPKLFSGEFKPRSTLPLVKPLVADLWEKPPAGPRLNEVKMTDKEFSSWPYLYPRYWVPFIYPVEGGVLFQGSTSAGDPLGKHSYLLNASYDTVTQKPSYGVSYLNATTPIDLSLSYSEIQQYLSGYDATLTDRAAAANSSFYLPLLSDRFRGGLGYMFVETESIATDIKRQGPSASIRYSTFVSEDSEGQDNSDPEGLTTDYNTQISLGHTQFLKQEEFIDYGRSTLSWNQVIKKWLPPGHSFVTQLRGTFAPEMKVNQIIALGDKTVGGNYIASLVTSSFLMRGYPSTTFIGRKMINGNFEYRFPLVDIYRGRELLPLFFKEINASLFVDGVAVDGAAYDSELGGYVRSELDAQYWGAGGELKLATTMAYQFPVTFILGAYYGFDQSKQGGFQPFFGIGIEGISDVNQRRQLSVKHE